MKVGRFLVVLLFLFCMVPLASHGEEAASLYHRLGGYDAIAAVTDDFIGRIIADPQLKPFFSGHSTDTLKKQRQHVINMICETAGGPCMYTGCDLKVAHAGLGITAAHWDLAVGYLVETLDHLKVPANEKEELLAMVSSTKGDIVEKP